jgi:hypothetical protein
MQLRVWSSFDRGISGGPRCQMVEGCANDIGADDTLPATPLMANGVRLDLRQAPFYSPGVGLYKPTIAANQGLDAYRLWRAENTVPAGRMLPVVSRGGDQYRAAARVKAPKQGREIVSADVSSKS